MFATREKPKTSVIPNQRKYLIRVRIKEEVVLAGEGVSPYNFELHGANTLMPPPHTHKKKKRCLNLPV